jgi:hypothetical protein
LIIENCDVLSLVTTVHDTLVESSCLRRDRSETNAACRELS